MAVEANIKETEDKMPELIFRNRTKIDQVVYDKSNSAITIHSGDTITGNWFERYASKNGPLVLTNKKEIEDREKDSKSKKSTGKKLIR